MSSDLNRDRTGKVTLHQLTKARIMQLPLLYIPTRSKILLPKYYRQVKSHWVAFCFNLVLPMKHLRLLEQCCRILITRNFKTEISRTQPTKPTLLTLTCPILYQFRIISFIYLSVERLMMTLGFPTILIRCG
jgi:hypothetical protein